MNRRTASRAMLGLSGLLGAATARSADANPLLGSWRLQSFVREIAATGERYDQLGTHPDGWIHYLADGRMIVMFVAGDQPHPAADVPTDAERIALHKSMLAYGGSYVVDPAKVIHRVDIAWNGARLGTDQVRFHTIAGSRLTLKTAPNRSPVDGREGVGILVFEKAPAFS